jgi:hypothetical protein
MATTRSEKEWAVETVAIVLTVSNLAALVFASAMARRARYWRSVVEGPGGTRLQVPDTVERLSGCPRCPR